MNRKVDTIDASDPLAPAPLILPDHMAKDATKSENQVIKDYIMDLESKLVDSGKVLSRTKQIIIDLKAMFEENLKLMSDLEMENIALKDKIKNG